MGYKNICFTCKKAFSQGNDFTKIHKSNCPECGNEMTIVNHSFRPPKKNEIKKWETVRFLVENGFIYHHVFELVEKVEGKIVSYQNYVKYPENLDDAKIFVEKYKDQAMEK